MRAWILLSALLSGAGWVLSAVHQLNQAGYVTLLLLALIVSGWYWRKFQPSLRGISRQFWRRFRLRFARPAPFLFLALALISLVGGALYVPTNIDTNAYRIPRVLHWLWQERWHWIHTFDPRFNSTGCGFEWLSAPLILFTRTDRLLYLIDWLSYLMLPGLIFSVFTRLGVRRRVAWWWMWFLASGWVFAVQAGSTGNDTFGTIYALAAVDLALRAGTNKFVGDLWLSMLAVALLTSVKQTNLPLALPWLIAASRSLKLLLARPLTTAGVAVACLLVSVVPLTVCNLVYSGDWMGFSRNVTGLQNPLWTHAKFKGSPFWGIVGNTFNISIQNLAPPYFPMAERWNAAMKQFVETPFGSHFAPFDRFGLMSRFAASELSGAGVGPAICILTLMTLFGGLKFRHATTSGDNAAREGLLRWLRLAPWAALLVFMAKSGSFAAGRYLAPYYPLLFPLMLAAPGHSRLVRQRWWQWLGLLVMFYTAILLLVSQDRPLLPVRALLSNVQQPQSAIVSKLSRFYGIESLSYSGVRNPFDKDLPQSERCIGYTSNGGLLEPGLWLPFGSRKVELVRAEDTRERLHQLGVRYVVVEDVLLSIVNETIEQWMDRYDAELIAKAVVKAQPSTPLTQLYLVRLR